MKRGLLVSILGGFSGLAGAQPYAPTWESLDKPPTPAWFQDAKSGIFIHCAEVFRRSGAKYVVPTSKHREGFALWPSREASATTALALGQAALRARAPVPAVQGRGDALRALDPAGASSGRTRRGCGRAP